MECTSDDFLFCAKSILRKLYLNFALILIFHAKNSHNDNIYFLEQYQTVFYFVKLMALLWNQILIPIFDSKVTEKFTFKFLIFTFENFEFSINHTSIPCTIPEISYQWLVPNVLISKNPPKMFRYCSKK